MNKQQVLIVDDEPINIKLVAEVLQERYNILVARSGVIALELLDKKLPDLILLDIKMPQMDGFEVAQKLKSNHKYEDIPIIFLTGDNSQETIVKAFAHGAVDYIIKPFQKEELNVRVDNHIRTSMLQKNIVKEFAKNEHLLRIIDAYVSFVKIDKKGIIQKISSSFIQQLYSSEEHLIGENISILSSGNMPLSFYHNIWKQALMEETFSYEIENKNFHDGTNWYHATISPDYDESNNFIGFIIFYENIDDKIKFKKLSETDKLTKLPNRARLDEVIKLEIERVNRYKDVLSIMLIDIDNFKDVNDHYGHQVGDIILQEFAAILSQNIRKIDFVGRWGGEEFLVVCPHTDADGAYVLAQNIRRVIEEYTFPIIGKKTASFGIAKYHFKESVENLFQEVDDALYAAKNAGKNCVKT